MAMVKLGIKKKPVKADLLPDHLKEHVKHANEANKTKPADKK